jgi:hypothetical protein
MAQKQLSAVKKKFVQKNLYRKIVASEKSQVNQGRTKRPGCTWECNPALTGSPEAKRKAI